MKNHEITACIVVHNEADLIERCLKSISDCVKEIIVVHDGACQDETINICSKFRCKVFEREFVGEAEPHRAWLYKQVKTQWILQLDADEFLSENSIRVINSLNFNDSITCYEFLWRAWNGSRYITKNWPYKKVLFKKDSIEFLAFPHEEVRIVHGTTKRLGTLLEHQPNYNNYSWKSFRFKWTKWIKIHARHYLQPLNKIDTFQTQQNAKPHYYNIMKFSPLSIFFLLPYHYIGMMLNGAITEGIYGLRISIMMSCYYSLVSIYVAYYRFLRTG